MAISPTVPRSPKPAPSGSLRGGVPASAPGPKVRRRISPQAGRALEILGHAIDYLTDEYVHHGGEFRPGDPELDAIELLMAANRAIYFECPRIPTLRERCLRFFGIGRR
ncbi:MAG: hypothetical protein WBE38_01805 [Terracidiphilus sp.]